MVIIKDTLVDLVGDADWDPKAYAEIWSTDELRDSGGTTVTDKRRQIPITAEGLETPELAAGTAFIRLHLGTLRPSLGPYAITIPDTTGSGASSSCAPSSRRMRTRRRRSTRHG